MHQSPSQGLSDLVSSRDRAVPACQPRLQVKMSVIHYRVDTSDITATLNILVMYPRFGYLYQG